MRKMLAGPGLVLGAAILVTGGIHHLAASDVCGHCFHIATWYWENVDWMGAEDIYNWLGACLDINGCMSL